MKLQVSGDEYRKQERVGLRMKGWRHRFLPFALSQARLKRNGVTPGYAIPKAFCFCNELLLLIYLQSVEKACSRGK